MNNAHSYAHALESKAKYIFDSDEEQQYEFRGSNIIRTQKSQSMKSTKQTKAAKQVNNNEMKKSNSFLLSSKSKMQSEKSVKMAEQAVKQKSKASKKCLTMNIVDMRKNPQINSKNSMNKTSISINSNSGISNTNKSMKTVKKRSISRDYLILDQEIYQCENIQEINQKLVCGNSKIYSHERFIKATLRNQQKLENYITAFHFFVKFSKRSVIRVDLLSEKEKKKLYTALKNETHHKQSRPGIQIRQLNFKPKADKVDQNQLCIETLVKCAVEKILQKSKHKIQQEPDQQLAVNRWKNAKLHHLMAFHSAFKQKQKNNSSRNSFSANRSSSRVIEYESFQVDQDFKNQCNAGKDQQEQLQNQLNKQIQEEWYNVSNSNEPVTSTQVNTDSKIYPTLNSFTQVYPKLQVRQQQITKFLPETHIFSNYGIQSFMHSFWDYLVDAELIPQLVHQLKQSYGLDNATMALVSHEWDNNKGQLTNFIINKSSHVLDDQIFVNFCKEVKMHYNISQHSGMQETDQRWIIIFQKAIFDCLNSQLCKFQTDYPLGSFHPLSANQNNSAYMIDEQNAMQVWDQCIAKIMTVNDIGIGLLKNKETDSDQNQAKMFQKSFLQLLANQSQQYIWERLQPLSNRITYESIFEHIERQLLGQFSAQLSQLK